MKPKHTPGPWYVVYSPKKRPGTFIRDRVDHLEISYCNSAETSRPEADARLIAAAPDMLAGLEAVETALEYQTPDTEDDRELLEKIKRALTKARGES